MTTYFEEDFESDEPAPVEWGALMNWAGALVSFALMAGLAVWGYQLLKRDVTGVPVVRALEGPMRVAPEHPGGVQAEYQDLSVTRVASDGAEEDPVEQVTLAPAPVDLAPEDQPMASLIEDTPSAAEPVAKPPAVAALPETEAATETGAATETAAAPEAAPASVPEAEPQSAIELAIAEALADTAPPEAEATEPGDGARVSPAMAGGIARSPRPVARPATVTNAVATAAANAASGPANALEVDVATIAPGTRLVQLGAFPSPEEARSAWESLDDRFGPYFDGKKRVVQEAAAGGSTFYRLRAVGFDDLSDARRFCAVLVAESANCIPVIRR